MAAILVACVALVTALVASPAALAQAWPARPVTVIAPSSAGSTPDIIARLLAQRLSEQLGQQFVVVNRVGAGGNVGSESVARAQPDGYTVLLGSIANTVNPHLMKNAGFTLDDLVPSSSVAAAPDVLVVHPDVPAKSVAELIAWLKSKPGTSMAIPGFGTTPHLSTELLRSIGRVDVNIVPYQGGGAVVQGLVANQIPAAFSTSLTVVGRVKAGQLRALGVSSAKRLTSLPDVPTMAEAGLAGFDVTAWFGFFTPAKTPRAIVDRLSDETRKALAVDDVRKRLTDLGADPLGSTPEAFAAYVKSEYDKWGRLIREAGIKTE